MLQNPDQAANLIRYAKRANELNPSVMPQLRESFLNKAVEQARTGNSPMDEMKALQSLQSKWGEKGGTQVVLNEMFGKDSPLSSPTTLAKVLAAPVPKEQMGWAENMASKAASAPYLLRAGVIALAAGGSAYGIYQHPERAPEIIAAMAGLALGAKLLRQTRCGGTTCLCEFPPQSERDQLQDLHADFGCDDRCNCGNAQRSDSTEIIQRVLVIVGEQQYPRHVSH